MGETDKAVIAAALKADSREQANVLERASAALFRAEGRRDSTAVRMQKAEGQLEVMEVQYNPSSLSVQAQGGRMEYGSPSGEGEESGVSQSSVEPELTLSVELILDGADTKAKMEKLISLFSSRTEGRILFAWGTFCFQGEIVNLDGSYRMFLPSGNPIRGSVRMTVRSVFRAGGEDQWEQQFKNMTAAERQ